jgi:hypothetical protein
MQSIIWNERSHSSRGQAAGRAVAAAALGLSCLVAAAQDPPRAARAVEIVAPNLRLADLEKVFWECDHAATVHGLTDVGTGMMCGVVTEELRLRRFNADFNAMLSWWRQNKVAEHGALDRAKRPGGYVE